MTINILHISDLHRSSEHPLKNEPLLHSLKMDKDRYLDENCGCLDLVFVSGDIIQGSSEKGAEGLVSINEQYEEAKRFFISLAEDLFDGDRNRIVIVPGNHDISWYYSINSMEKIDVDLSDKERVKTLVKQLSTSQNLRFNWEDLSFYRISDSVTYNARFQQFSTFYEGFYENHRKYSLDPDCQFDVFAYDDLNLTVAAFNSCYCNDHLCKEGKINPICISKSCLELERRLRSQGATVAIWHHNTSGSPYQSDYIDPIILENISEMNVEVAFHGHQHHSEIISRFSKIFSDKQLYLVSAPSLCAGPSQLPVGYKRGYNVIEIDIPEGKLKIKSREMKKSAFESPIWGEAIMEGFNKMSVELPIRKIVPDKNIVLKLISEIESMLGNRKFSEALQALEHIPEDNIFKRRLLFMAMSGLDMNEEITRVFFPPQTIQESLLLLEIYWENREYEQLDNVLSLEPLVSTLDPGIKAIADDYAKRVKVFSGAEK